MSLTHAVGWDWYEGSIFADAADVIHGVAKALGGEIRPIRALMRYDAAAGVYSGEELLFGLHWGDKLDHCHFVVTGKQARHVVPELRRCHREHGVSRVDVAVDVLDGWSYLEAAAEAIKLAQAHSITTSTEGDWVAGVKGRSLYIGARSSERRRVLYEKGIEQGSDARDWVRFELRVRPSSREKGTYAAMSPQQVLASDRFARELLNALRLDVALAPVELPNSPRVRRDVSRARRALAAQYTGHILEWVREAGSADEFLVELSRVYEAENAVRRIARGAAARPGGPSPLPSLQALFALCPPVRHSRPK